MARLLPTEPDVTVERGDEPAVLCLDDDRTGELLAAVSSETARAVFRAVSAEPVTAADLADGLDMSIQRVRYHLDNLVEVGLIEVADTCYSEKGREMDVYAPTAEPLLVFFGPESDRAGLEAGFRGFAGAMGPSAVLLALAESLSRLLGLGSEE